MGIAILLIDAAFNFEIKSLLGVGSALAFGFTPTGIGMLLIYRNSRKNPKMIKNIQLENEERNMFISVILSNIINISFYKFGVFTLIFMPIVYFFIVIINHRRYWLTLN